MNGVVANADEDAVEIAASQTTTASGKTPTAALRELPDGTRVARQGGTVVTAPDNSRGSVSISSANAPTFSLGLPQQGSGVPGESASDGSTVYRENGDSAAIVVQAVSGGVRVATVIADSSQPTAFSYPLAADIAPVVNPDGSVDLWMPSPSAPDAPYGTQTLVEIGHIQAPWAKDATGKAIPTRYIKSGHSLVQQVDHRTSGVEYPVVADPTITNTGISQIRIRWNRAETAAIAQSGWAPGTAAAVCGGAGLALAGPIGAAAFAAACAAASGSVVYNASVAQNSKPKRCVQLTETAALVVMINSYACK